MRGSAPPRNQPLGQSGSEVGWKQKVSFLAARLARCACALHAEAANGLGGQPLQGLHGEDDAAAVVGVVPLPDPRPGRHPPRAHAVVVEERGEELAEGEVVGLGVVVLHHHQLATGTGIGGRGGGGWWAGIATSRRGEGEGGKRFILWRGRL